VSRVPLPQRKALPVGLLNPHRPSVWTVFACCAAAVGVLAFWIAIHPDIWGTREFEGMAQTIVFGSLAMGSIPVVLVLAAIGTVRKDPLAFVLFIIAAALATYLAPSFLRSRF